jgi:hypothetical protein
MWSTTNIGVAIFTMKYTAALAYDKFEGFIKKIYPDNKIDVAVASPATNG